MCGLGWCWDRVGISTGTPLLFRSIVTSFTSQDAPQSSMALTGCGKMGSEAFWGELFKSGPVEEVG